MQRAFTFTDQKHKNIQNNCCVSSLIECVVLCKFESVSHFVVYRFKYRVDMENCVCVFFPFYEMKIDFYQVISCAVVMTTVAPEIHAIRAWINSCNGLNQILKEWKYKPWLKHWPIYKKKLRVFFSFLQNTQFFLINHVCLLIFFQVYSPKGSFKLHEQLACAFASSVSKNECNSLKRSWFFICLQEIIEANSLL